MARTKSAVKGVPLPPNTSTYTQLENAVLGGSIWNCHGTLSLDGTAIFLSDGR